MTDFSEYRVWLVRGSEETELTGKSGPVLEARALDLIGTWAKRNRGVIRVEARRVEILRGWVLRREWWPVVIPDA